MTRPILGRFLERFVDNLPKGSIGMTPQDAIEWADAIDRRLGPISGRQADALAVFLRRVARNLELALEDRARVDWLDRTPPAEQRATAICQMAGEPVRQAIDRQMRATPGAESAAQL